MTKDKIINLQRYLDLKNRRLFCGEFYIHKETRTKVKLGALSPEDAVLVDHESLPYDYPLIWHRETFTNEFVAEATLDASIDMIGHADLQIRACT